MEADRRLYDLYFDDERGCAVFVSYDTMDGDDVRQLFPALERLWQQRGVERRLMLGDISRHAPRMLNAAARRAVTEFRDVRIDRIAVFGANPLGRMLAKIMLALIGKTHVARFFAGEEAAVAWLQAAPEEPVQR